MDIETLIKKQIADNSVILYMKGTPQFPQCGFSARTVEALTQVGEPFAYVNILENPEIRSTLPRIANWPTFPQLWVKGAHRWLRHRYGYGSKGRVGTAH